MITYSQNDHYQNDIDVSAPVPVQPVIKPIEKPACDKHTCGTCGKQYKHKHDLKTHENKHKDTTEYEYE